jgi:hypothetical protein
MDLKETGWEGVQWIQLAQDWGGWRATALVSLLVILLHCTTNRLQYEDNCDWRVRKVQQSMQFQDTNTGKRMVVTPNKLHTRREVLPEKVTVARMSKKCPAISALIITKQKLMKRTELVSSRGKKALLCSFIKSMIILQYLFRNVTAIN